MSRTPATQRDLHLEDDLFGAIKQLLAWEPPPKGERTRSRYSYDLVRMLQLSADNQPATDAK